MDGFADGYDKKMVAWTPVFDAHQESAATMIGILEMLKKRRKQWEINDAGELAIEDPELSRSYDDSTAKLEELQTKIETLSRQQMLAK